MKVAILIGVDQYDNYNNLPACRNDLSLMESIIVSTGQYSERLIIADSSLANSVKMKISDFLSGLHGKEIDEVFFYFTGHGDFFDDQFYYILSDFSSHQRKQTSLENSEVDNWLRSLKPKLTIKVIDACYSGVTYIKNIESINEHLEKSKTGFQDCYFMFSSKLNQSSYQNAHLSYFTRSFICALHKKNEGNVRYKDIIDYISDDFEQTGSQTPIFITQGTYTEIFCNLTSKMSAFIDSVCGTPSDKDEKKDNLDNKKFDTLEEIIKHDSSRYCTVEEAKTVLLKLKEYCEELSFSSELSNLFDTQYDFSSYDSYQPLPKEELIGRWLSKSGTEYFANPTEDEEPYEREVPDYTTPSAIFRGGYRTITRYRTVINGFEITSNLEYDLLRIDAIPKYPNIPPFNCTVLILFSKSRLSLFCFHTQYKEKNWSTKELVHDIKWRRSEIEYKMQDDFLNEIKKIKEEFEIYITDYLNNKFKHFDD